MSTFYLSMISMSVFMSYHHSMLSHDMSTFYLSIISMSVFMKALVSLSLQYKHLLSVLLSLEAATMMLFMLFFGFANNVMCSGQSALSLIALSACEASLGLAIVVILIPGRSMIT